MIRKPDQPQYPPGHIYRNGWPFPCTTGEYSKSAKLTDAQVEEIRRRKVSGEKAVSLAKEFGVHEMHVYQLCRKGRRAKPTPTLRKEI